MSFGAQVSLGSLKSASALLLVTRHGLPAVSVPRVGLFLVHEETEEVAVELGLGLGLGLALGDALALALADALGEALAATSGTILAEVFAVLVALAVGLVLADGLVPAEGSCWPRGWRSRSPQGPGSCWSRCTAGTAAPGGT